MLPLGHAADDAFLSNAALKISFAVRGADLVSSAVGYELVVLLVVGTTKKVIEDIRRRIFDTVAEPSWTDASGTFKTLSSVSASIGRARCSGKIVYLTFS